MTCCVIAVAMCSWATVIRFVSPLANSMERRETVDDCIRYQTPVESRQLPAMGAGQSQEISIGYLPRIQQARGVDALTIEKSEVVRPEFVAGKASQAGNHFGHRRRSSWRVRVPRMSDNPEHAVLGQRTGGPCLSAQCREPFMGPVVLNVRRINQGDQDIHIEQKPNQGNSSRSRCTSSEVTGGVPGRTGSRGTPLRVRLPDSAGRNACLASEEITAPTLFRSAAANSLAAASTSSSITRVVRIV